MKASMSLSPFPDHTPSPPPRSRAQQEEDIQEVVLLHIIKTPHQFVPPVVFISVNGQDPNPQFLERFIPHQITAKPESESAWGFIPLSNSLDPNNANALIIEDVFQEVIDPTTEQSSAIYSASKVQWVDDMTVRLSGGWVAGSLAALYSDYELSWSGQIWEITKKVETWMS